MVTMDEKVSTFALIVDKLRGMSEAELKLLYIKLFKEELIKDWEEVTSQADFRDVTDEEIVEVIQRNRYSKENG